MSAGIAEATSQMCSSRSEARNQAKAEVIRTAGEHGYKTKTISYNEWSRDVGSITYYYCKAWAEVF